MAFINEIKRNFTTIPNGILDSNLNSYEIAIITYIASKPTGWEFSCERIGKGINASKDCVDKYVKSLIEKGYITRKRLNTGKVEYTLGYPPCSSSQVVNTHIGLEPKRVTPTVAHTLSGSQPLISNTIGESNTIRESNTINNNISLGRTFESSPDKESKKKIKLFKYEEKHLILAKEFQHYKLQTHDIASLKNANLEEWADTVRKLEEIDGKEFDVIEKVLGFALQDNFWINNLISLKGIRDKNKNGLTKFDQIEAKAVPKKQIRYEEARV